MIQPSICPVHVVTSGQATTRHGSNLVTQSCLSGNEIAIKRFSSKHRGGVFFIPASKNTGLTRHLRISVTEVSKHLLIMVCAQGAKLKSDDRRTHILRAVQCVFADKGFHGTTTKELAAAAGVSEALLFKHFPSKQALYEAIFDEYISNKPSEWQEVTELEPSTETLIRIVVMLVTRMVNRRQQKPDTTAFDRMLLRSLCEDGAYARIAFGKAKNCLVDKLHECLKVSKKNGDLVDAPLKAGPWLAHHLAMMILVTRVPGVAIVEYGVKQSQLIDEAVTFCLRGLGLRQEVLARYMHPKSKR
jgi:AcrR family transcriptional regulator